MQVIQKEELRFLKDEVVDRILAGEIFIYPTDTIYGIGCDATNPEAVNFIRKIKQRENTPFSVIVPSEDWILDNCVVSDDAEKWLKELPGPLTLIMKQKDSDIAPELAPGLDSVGVRIPQHWISNLVSLIGKPIVTTSVNVTDQPFMTSLDDLDDDIKRKVNFCIYEGEKQGRPSKIIHLENEETKVRER